MKYARNEKGIALVTSLMFTLIILVMIMGLMSVMTQNIKVSGSQRSYKNALEASQGGAEVVMKEILPLLLQGSSVNAVTSSFSGMLMQFSKYSTCTRKKLTLLPMSQWPASCGGAGSTNINPKDHSDFTFTLQAKGTAGGMSTNSYSVYAKIVDSNVHSTDPNDPLNPNTDASGLQLEGAGVSEESSIFSPVAIPHVYRIEVQGEKTSNPLERGKISVLYAY